jgi:hypothetical protein
MSMDLGDISHSTLKLLTAGLISIPDWMNLYTAFNTVRLY